MVRSMESKVESEDNLRDGKASRSVSSHSALPYTVDSIDLLKRRAQSITTIPTTSIVPITLSTIATMMFCFVSLGLGDADATVEVVDIGAAVKVAADIEDDDLRTVGEVLIAIKPGLEQKIDISQAR